MKRIVGLATLALCGAATLAAAAGAASVVRFDAERARVYRSGHGQGLTAASERAPSAVVSAFLRSRGRDAATLRSLVAVSLGATRSGTAHLRLEQQVQGLRLWGAYAKAAVNSNGELVHLIDNLVAVPRARTAPARIGEREALRAAVRTLYPDLRIDLAAAGGSGDTVEFRAGGFFHGGPTVTRMVVPMDDGSLQIGFLVETWSERGNQLHETLVGGDGRILDVELRTNTDAYNVFPIDPDKTPQEIVAGPGVGNAESPAGWLFPGSHQSVDIAGNNVHAYLDTDDNDAPDAGGTTVSDGDFLTAADLDASPSTTGNQDVAVQNLFYLNNVIHDTLYRHGFDEAAGNFQEDNFGTTRRGGGDPVNAEGQDGGGTDNANFATPRDGRSPRMQMYLWTGLGDHQVLASGTTYLAQGAEFGPALDATGVTGTLALVDDNAGTVTDACEALTPGTLVGKIALIDRGTCTFVTKVKNAQDAGASAAIIANNAGDSIFTMGGTDATIVIPSVFVGQSDGASLKAAGSASATVRLTDPPPLQRDGDVDSDIVWHEYCHGLTWRMIGRMDRAMSGAIGEGMSDVCSILANNDGVLGDDNEDDVVGEYSIDDPLGIRTAPYKNYPRTYGDFSGTEVHFDGEIYGAIGWHLREVYLGAGETMDTLWSDVVGGMNYTPAGPAFEDMRDGILAQVSGSGRECLVWHAFADFGVGVGAKGTVRGSTAVITESFALPVECTP